TAMAESHFKGISAYGSRLFFTHTDIGTGGGVGKIPIGPQPDFANAINTGKPFDVSPENLQHPCSSQPCGQFMAMGLQTSGDDLTGSCIQFYDLSPVVDGKQMRLIGSLPWPGGINGVALGRESGSDGKYVLAGIQGSNLQIKRSRESRLVDSNGHLN